ncbi:MAG: HAMP domain-containing protein [Deltaproteobacteria bacterium]|nr:HAMP domain-containing protein [Deltaproteobacteria bacterium]
MVFSLQKRFLLLLLLPVTLSLTITGVTLFIYTRSYLLDDWTSMVKLRFEKTAHQVQMQLDKKRTVVDMIADAETNPGATAIQAFLSHQLSEMEGVLSVEILSMSPSASRPETTLHRDKLPNNEILRNIYNVSTKLAAMINDDAFRKRSGMGGHHSHLKGTAKTHNSVLSFDDSNNVLLVTEYFGGTEQHPAKEIVVRISFDSLIKDILEVGQWHHSYACLVKPNGQYLAHTNSSMNRFGGLGETGDPLEKKVLEEMTQRNFGTILGEGYPPDRMIGFYKVPTTDWYLVLVSRGADVLAPIARFSFNYVFFGSLFLLCTGVLISWNTRPIAQSITVISKAAEEVERGNYTLTIPEDRSDEIGMLKQRFNNMILGLKQRDLIERTFGRYVDAKVAVKLLAKPENLQLGGKNQTVTILMADLRGFTQMCEKLKPEDVISLLNMHFSNMITVIEEFNGIIVDFYGDSVLAFFQGTSEDVFDRAEDAVRCALAMQRKLQASTKNNIETRIPEVEMGIGVHTGEVIVGNIGSKIRAKYGIVGSAVNETDRIQSCARGGTIMISEKTYELLSKVITVGPKYEVTLKGLDGVRNLYEVKDISY